MAEAKRRLAAILAADVAGYSRLMSADEEDTIAALKDCRALFTSAVEARQGRIVDTAGDSVLAVFDSVVEALRAAISAQERLAERNTGLPDDRQMRYRIGVNLGDIVEETDGTIYGDGVNVAARLQALAEPGGIMLGALARQAIGDKLDVTFADAGEHTVKNISQPVRAYAVLIGGATAPARPRSRRTGKRVGLVAAAGVAALVIAGFFVWQSPDAPDRATEAEVTEDTADEGADAASRDLPQGPSIAVLPFDNLSSEPDKDYFADGITEEIITGLTRFNELFVLARNTTFQYKGQAVDIVQLGEELGVDYLIEGSVRRAGDAVRVTAQLVQASDGSQMWAESFERDLTADSLFAIQDQITERIVGTIAGAHGVIARAGASAALGEPPENLDAYECVLQMHAARRTLAAEAHLSARDCLERAVEMEPNYADAWASLALAYIIEYSRDLNPRPDSIERSLEAARQAVTLDPTSAWARLSLARALFFDQDLQQSVAEAQAAVELNPMNADILGTAGYYMNFAGHYAEGIALIERAMALNPVYPAWYRVPEFLALYRSGRYEAALDVAKATVANADNWLAKVRLLICYGQLGDTAAGQETLEEILTENPNFVSDLRSWMRKWNFDAENTEMMLDGLRKAGITVSDSA